MDHAAQAPEYVDTQAVPEVVPADKQTSYPQAYSQDRDLHSKGDATRQDLEAKNHPIDNKKPRRLAGLPVWGFWTLISVIGLVIIGASVGGAVGGTSGKIKSNGLDVSTALWTSTDCPYNNGELYTPNTTSSTSPGAYTFTKNCGQAPPSGLWDITEAFVQSFDRCIDMCSSWNYYEYEAKEDHPGAQKCVGAVFSTEAAPPGNCWIKNAS